MARLFISYSRTDEAFARRLAESFSALGVDVWIDVEDIPAGMKWSSAIQQGLNKAELMLVIISPTSMASSNVEDEWQYFLDKKKAVIPVRWLPADVHFQLNRLQYIDFHQQPYDIAFARLLGELGRKGFDFAPSQTQPQAPPAEQIAATPPPVHEVVPKPPTREEYFNMPAPAPQVTRKASLPASRNRWVGGAIVSLLIVTFVGALLLSNSQGTIPAVATQRTQTENIADADDPLTSTADAMQQAEEVATQLAQNTAQAQAAALTQTAIPLTLTAAAATFTPPPTLGYSSANPVTRNADWRVVSQVMNGYEMVLVPAGGFMMGASQAEIDYAARLCQLDANTCNTLLSDENYQRPMTFDAPFWIDRYEVAATGSDEPATPTLQEAEASCHARGGRLPTESEWEYAARGPDGLYFPWGNTFDSTRANYCDSNCEYNWKDNAGNDGYARVAPVTAFPNGESWVGARNMGGNVWEYTATLYHAAPSGDDDDNDDDSGNTSAPHTLKGGGWTWLSMETRASTRDDPIQPRTEYYGFRCMIPYIP